MIPVRGTLRGAFSPLVALALVACNVVVFLQELSLPPGDVRPFVFAYGLVPAREVALASVTAAVFNSITSMFVHGGWAHVLWNMLFLWVFGSGLESRVGHARFAGLYLAAGLVAAQAQALSDPLSRVPILGASGAIAGVLGAYFVLSPRAKITVLFPIGFIPLFFDVPAVIFLGLWFAQQIFSQLFTFAASASGGVAWWAHIAGFVAGGLLVKLLGVPPVVPKRDSWPSTTGAGSSW